MALVTPLAASFSQEDLLRALEYSYMHHPNTCRFKVSEDLSSRYVASLLSEILNGTDVVYCQRQDAASIKLPVVDEFDQSSGTIQLVCERQCHEDRLFGDEEGPVVIWNLSRYDEAELPESCSLRQVMSDHGHFFVVVAELMTDSQEVGVSDVAVPPLRSMKTEFRELAESSGEEFVRRLLHIHERFWHAQSERLLPLLLAAGIPTEKLRHLDEMLSRCSRCRELAKPFNKPAVRGLLASFFNDLLEMDCTQFLGTNLLVVVDLLFKMKGGGVLDDMTAKNLCQVFMNQWIKFYGPPRKVICDQGGNFAGLEFGTFLERLGIKRQLGGSDARRIGSAHTATGTVEKANDLLKTTMLKLYCDLSDAGIPVEISEVFSEACAAHNELLTFNGVTPNMGVFGRPSRDLYDLCNSSPQAGSSSPEDVADRAVLLRQHAKAAVLRSVAEHRLARAQHAHHQVSDLVGKAPGTLVDLYRRPASKDAPGWRGPATLVDLSELTGTAIVTWQGRPYVVPLRHVRPHAGVGLVYRHVSACAYFKHGKSLDLTHLTHVGSGPNESRALYTNSQSSTGADVQVYTVSQAATGTAVNMYPTEDYNKTNSAVVSLMSLMDMADSCSFGKTAFRGKVWFEELQAFRMLPPGSSMQDKVHKAVYRVCAGLMKGLKHDGIRYGTAISRLSPMPRCFYGVCVFWERTNRSKCFQQIVNPSLGISVRQLTTSWKNTSVLMVYSYSKQPSEDPELDKVPDVNMEDIPGYPFNDDGWSSYDSGGEIDVDNPMSSDEGHVPPFNPPRPPDAPDQLVPSPPPSDVRMPSPPVTDQEMAIPDERMSGHETTTETMETDVPTTDHSSKTKPRKPKRKKSPKSSNSEHDPDAASSHQHPHGAASSDPRAPLPAPQLPLVDDDDPAGTDPAAHQPEMYDISTPNDSETEAESESRAEDPDDSDATVDYGYVDPLGPLCAQYAAEIDDALRSAESRQTGTLVGFSSSKVNNLEVSSFLAMSTDFHVPYPGKKPLHFFLSIAEGEAFRVDQMTDNLSPEEMVKHEEDIKLADLEEIRSFISNDVWRLRRARDAKTKPIDCTWVRKFKLKMINGRKTRVIKCRLCIRGFADPQKNDVFKSSSTATRLSQKLILSQASIHEWPCESWDVSTAFLQGLKFSDVSKVSKLLGTPDPVVNRSVFLKVPGNVWYHLKKLGWLPDHVTLEECLRGDYVLECIKPMYGLVDAPILWNLALRAHLVLNLGATASTWDDNFYMFFKDGPPATSRADASALSKRTLLGLMSTHVDDTNSTGKQQCLDTWRAAIEKKFGKVTRQLMPYNHLGISFSKWNDGFAMDQQAYCMQIKKVAVERQRDGNQSLSPDEVTQLRGIIGALIYLCFTRPDIHADLTLLAQRITKATVKDLRAANSLVDRAKRNSSLGLKFPKLTPPLHVLAISDASHASGGSSYAIEGTFVALVETPSLFKNDLRDGEYPGSQLNFNGHLLFCGAHRSKRISHGTSHAESLGVYQASLAGEQIAQRITELYSPYHLSLQNFMELDDQGLWEIGVSSVTDCFDVIQLLVGQRGVPQDRSQRLVVLSLRERRLISKIRNLVHVRTQDMVANCLTKHVSHCPQLHACLTAGCVQFKHTVTLFNALPPRHDEDYFEHNLEDMNQ